MDTVLSVYLYDADIMIVLPETVEDVVVKLLRLSNTRLSHDIGWALEAAAGWETNEIAYSQLGCIMDNVKNSMFLEDSTHPYATRSPTA